MASERYSFLCPKGESKGDATNSLPVPAFSYPLSLEALLVRERA